MKRTFHSLFTPKHRPSWVGSLWKPPFSRLVGDKAMHIDMHSPENEKRPPGRAPPEKASECLVRRRLTRRWAQGYGHPGFTVTPPRELTSLVSLATHGATRRVARNQTVFYNFGQSVSREKAYHSYSKNTYPFSTQDCVKKTYFALQSASYHRFHDLDSSLLAHHRAAQLFSPGIAGVLTIPPPPASKRSRRR